MKRFLVVCALISTTVPANAEAQWYRIGGNAEIVSFIEKGGVGQSDLGQLYLVMMFFRDGLPSLRTAKEARSVYALDCPKRTAHRMFTAVLNGVGKPVGDTMLLRPEPVKPGGTEDAMLDLVCGNLWSTRVKVERPSVAARLWFTGRP